MLRRATIGNYYDYDEGDNDDRTGA